MKKIFISHSSSDKEIVDVFIDKILILGLNLEVQDIACTSREDTGVVTGEDIREFIKENISNCDFVFFMVSENYKNSPICLNEMGAAWATNRNVKPLVFPNISFDSIGWLYNVRKGMMLNDSSALDSLYEDISEISNNKSRISTWNKQKNEFLDFVRNTFSLRTQNQCIAIIEEEEIDLLDCREKFDYNILRHQECLMTMTQALNKNTENFQKGTKMLQHLNQNINSSPSIIRNIMLKMAHSNNSLADVCDKESPKIKIAFIGAMEASIKLRELTKLNDEDIQEEYQSVQNLIDSMNDLLASTISYKQTVEQNETNIDKTYSKSKKRLVNSLSEFITITEENINKANELLLHTA